MTAFELTQKILEESHIIYHALKAKKLEIALVALKRRKELIEQLKNADDKNDPRLEAQKEAFKTINDQCAEALFLLKESLDKDLTKTKVERQDVYKANKVRQQYKMVSSYMVGSHFDSMKKKGY